MGLPATQLVPLMRPAVTGVTPPADGVGGFAALCPVDEPTSAGEPPVAPGLISVVSKQYRAREVRSVAGYAHTASLGVDARAMVSVEWNTIDAGALGDVLDFLASVTGAAGGAAGFDVRPDGPLGNAVTVRPVADPVTTQLKAGIFTVTVACETLHGEP